MGEVFVGCVLPLKTPVRIPREPPSGHISPVLSPLSHSRTFYLLFPSSASFPLFTCDFLYTGENLTFLNGPKVDGLLPCFYGRFLGLNLVGKRNSSEEGTAHQTFLLGFWVNIPRQKLRGHFYFALFALFSSGNYRGRQVVKTGFNYPRVFGQCSFNVSTSLFPSNHQLF